MTPNKKKLGAHINDFYTEHKEYAQTFECVFCGIISPDNFCLFCGHCICQNCLFNGKQSEKCPIDKDVDIIKDINAFNKNYIGKTLLNKLKVYCIFKKDGCEWSGLFKDFEKKHLPECEYYKRKSNENSLNNDVEHNNIIKDNISYESNSLNENNKIHFDNKIMNGNSSSEDISIIYNDDEMSEFQNKNDLLNKKRKISKDFKIENENNDKDKFNLEEQNNFYNINDNQILEFYKNNDILDNEILLPEESSDEKDFINCNNDNSASNANIENIEKIENIEIMNNNIIINSHLTCNIFPYYYYFTEPLYYSFTCLIKSISRNILKDNKEISFGLTNIDNYEYVEILSTKKNEYLFFKDDIIRISYDNDLFIIYFENNKTNYMTIPFKNNEEIRYYPTIILNDKDDILEVSHN